MQHKNYLGISDGPPLPKSFQEACKIPHWADAIDREYEACVRRGTWKLISRTDGMNPVPFKWRFRAKRVEDPEMEYIFKERCNLRGDLQEDNIDFDPENLYAPVAAHEPVRLLYSAAGEEDLELEGCDVPNAYLNGSIDLRIIIDQPTNLSGRQAKPGYVCLLLSSIYGARQSGRI